MSYSHTIYTVGVDVYIRYIIALKPQEVTTPNTLHAQGVCLVRFIWIFVVLRNVC